MKVIDIKTLLLGCIVIMAMSCQQDAGVPEDLAGKRKYVSIKKKQLKALQAEIDKVNKEILKLDPPKEKAAVKVETIELQAKEFNRFIEVQGQVTADEVVNVSSEIGGRIMSMTVREGSYVKKGQLIATTDMSTLETQIAEIKTSLDLATTVFERQERLWKQNIGSELQFLEAKSNKERLEKSLNTINSQISKKNVYAPISGVVDMEFLKQGETAAPGMPIVQILNTGNLKLVANLQESLLNSVSKGDKVDIYFPAFDEKVTKTVSMIGRSVDPANRTFKVEINTGSMGGKLKPNLMAQVRFKDLTQKNTIMIPINSIQEDVRGNKFVFVTKKVGQQLRAEKRLIEIGESNGQEAVVIIGLDAQDQLITAGAMNLSENDLITTVQTESTDGK